MFVFFAPIWTLPWVIFVLFFLVSLYIPLFLRLLERKALDPNVQKCLYVGYFEFCLVCCRLRSVAYTSLCWGLKYLLKMPYFIQDYLNVTGFFILEFFWASWQYGPIFEKISQKWMAFAFFNIYHCQTFTEFVSN